MSGGAIAQETRGWVEDEGITVSQRTKEQAHDYRYFPEPDLPPLTMTAVEDGRQFAPRLPNFRRARRDRFVRMYGLSDAEAAPS